MPLKVSNNATSLLSSSINQINTVVSITGGDESYFPTLGPDEWCPITVTKSTGEREVMRCTARNGVDLTVMRGQENTLPLIFDAGQARVDCRLTAGAIEEIAIQDKIYSVAAGMSAGFRTASDRFAWTNSKDFATGGQIANMDKLGNFQVNGTITANSSITAVGPIFASYVQTSNHVQSSGYFLGSTLIMLAPTTAGHCYMRPNTHADPAGQFYVTPAGHAHVSGTLHADAAIDTGGAFTTAGHLTCTSGYFIGNTAHAVLGNAGTGPGTVYLRPNGATSGINHTMIHSNGNLTCAGQITADSIFQSTDVQCVIAATNGGSVALRPNGAGSTFEQVLINTNGDVVCQYDLYLGHTEPAPYNSGGLYAGLGMREKAGKDAATYGTNWITFNWTSGNAFAAYVDNTIFAITGTLCDHRVKREVIPLERAWDRIKALRPISYRYKDYEKVQDDGRIHWGFIAHEVQETLTESAATGEKDGKDLQALDAMAIISALTSALQEAQLRIEALEARFA